MNRRGFLKASAAGAAAVCLARCGQSVGAEAAGAAATVASEAAEGVALCGLFCGICKGKMDGECHGCGCTCGKCAGAAHRSSCAIAKCAAQKQLESCADCKDLPCTRLIQFAQDPVWRTHSVCLDNLRRRKAIGTAAWLQEQEGYWKDDAKARQKWLALYAECDRKHNEVARQESLNPQSGISNPQ
jgi:hypothetical protein